MEFINVSIRELENRLVNTLNESDVPIECKRLVLLNIYNQAKTQSDEIVMKEINEFNKGEQEKDEQSISEIELC